MRIVIGKAAEIGICIVFSNHIRCIGRRNQVDNVRIDGFARQFRRSVLADGLHLAVLTCADYDDFVDSIIVQIEGIARIFER